MRARWRCCWGGRTSSSSGSPRPSIREAAAPATSPIAWSLPDEPDIPVAAGAGVSLTTLRVADPVVDDERYWPATLPARPSPPGAALDLLDRSIAAGATIVGIGPYTNLALLEVARPGSLGRVPVVVMGGWVRPPAAGLPAWGPEMDWNVQWDTRAAEIVAATADADAGHAPGHAQGASPRRPSAAPARRRTARRTAGPPERGPRPGQRDDRVGPRPRRPAGRSAQLPLRPRRLRRRARLGRGGRRGDAPPPGARRRDAALPTRPGGAGPPAWSSTWTGRGSPRSGWRPSKRPNVERFRSGGSRAVLGLAGGKPREGAGPSVTPTPSIGSTASPPASTRTRACRAACPGRCAGGCGGGLPTGNRCARGCGGCGCSRRRR